jgi:hypothetical protein
VAIISFIGSTRCGHRGAITPGFVLCYYSRGV